MKKISFVGAGPGALDLLTIRAQNRLKEAEVLLWTDSLIPSEIIKLVPSSCECISTSKLTLEEILSTLIDRYKQGKRVIRLHDGDPCLYGAISEQICGLANEGIEVEVVPGVSAYQATAAKLNAELTIPGVVQTIVLSRAGGRTGVPNKENIEKLAALGASLCIYLSARHVEETQEALLKHYPEDTLVAIAHRISWDDEWITTVPLKEMAAASREQNLIRTTLYLISPALEAKDRRSKLYSKEHDHLFRPKPLNTPKH